MKRLRSEREKVIPRLFDLTEDSVEYRNRMRTYANAAVWFVLSFLTMALFIFLAESMLQRFTIIGLSFIKYLPLIFVVYAIARTKAATYLADVFELEDESVAYNFIEEVAFGDGSEQITINEGKISEKDEQSSIILIGGPGYVQVNLDSVALLERVNGTPEIIHTRPQPWKLGRFERIREIGKYDEVGKREYAIINLRDQFVRGLTVKSRTKDGIPIEAQDIKVMFSILRKPKEDQTDPNPYHFDENAVYSLVYNQIIITPPPKAAGVSFPWDTTVIPLVAGELEDLITSRNLSEILASISVREVDAINQGEATNIQMRLEMTGEQTVTSIPGSSKMPNFESRSKITAQFFSDAFKEKASKLGVAVHWIDIGTWQLPNEIILEELKGAWKMMRENAARRNAIERSGKRHEMQGFLDLVNSVIIGNYNRSSSGGSSNRKLSEKEYLELMRMVEDNPEIVSNPRLQQRFSNNAASKKDAHTVVIEVLKAFRHELIAARELIQKENRSSIEKQAEISKIEKALRDIDYYVFPT